MRLLWLNTVAAWIITAAGVIAVAVIHQRIPGAPEGVLRYWGVMLAAALSLGLTAASLGLFSVKHRLLVGSLFILIAGSALLLFISANTVPRVSATGGGIVSYAFCSAVISLVVALAAFFAVILYQKQAALAVLAAQSVILAVALLAGGGLGHCRLVDHWGAPVPVSRLKISGGMSIPLVEESCAYVLDRGGRLYAIDLAAAEKAVIARVPLPEPAEAGCPHLLKAENWAEPLYGSISRLSGSTLQVVYPYTLKHADGSLAGLWSIAARVDPETGKVGWRVLEERSEPEYYKLAPVCWGSHTLAMGKIDLWELTVEGPGVKTVIWQKEELHWLESAPGRLMAATKRGTFYIVDVSQH